VSALTHAGRRVGRSSYLVYSLAKRAIFARYRESLLGPLWAVITPLALLVIYSFVFAQVFQTRWDVPGLESVNFGLLLFSGLLIFGFFAESVNGGTGVVSGNSALVKRTTLPLISLPLLSLFVAGLTTALGSIPFVIFYGYELGLPPVTALLLPVVLIPLVVMVTGLTYAIAGLSVYFRDLVPAVSLLTTFILFTSPIFYPESAVPEDLQWVMKVNPVAVALSQSKSVLFAGTLPDWSQFGIYLGSSAITLLLGLWLYRRVAPGFADVI